MKYAPALALAAGAFLLCFSFITATEKRDASFKSGYDAGVAAAVNLIEAQKRECRAEKAVIAQICKRVPDAPKPEPREAM